MYCDERLEGYSVLAALAGAAQLGANVNSNVGAYEVFDYLLSTNRHELNHAGPFL